MPQTLTKRGWSPTGFCLRGQHQPDVIRALWETTDAAAQRWAVSAFFLRNPNSCLRRCAAMR